MARYARASIGRLLLTGLIFGIVSGAVISWLATSCIAPVIDEAIEKLPVSGAIENGLLQWPDSSDRLLAANAFTSVEVRLEEGTLERAPVDFAFELHTNSVVLRSLLGIHNFEFPRGYTMQLNRPALRPQWGAWRAPILFGLIPGAALALLLSWAALAVLYAIPVLTLGKLASRDLNPWRAWKMCVAAQLPGSLIISFGLALYSTGQISVVFVFAMYIAHFAATFLYLLLSPFFVPKAETNPLTDNPFDSEPTRKKKEKNPFGEK